jgi:hypothetical protein
MTTDREPRTRQVNFRVTADEWEVLRALANIDESTVPTAAYRIVQREVERQAKDPHVQADIANRQSARSEPSAKVVNMKGRRSRPRG